MRNRIGVVIVLVAIAGMFVWARGEFTWTEIVPMSELEESIPYLHETEGVLLYLVLLEDGPVALKTDDPHPRGCEIHWNEVKSYFYDPCLGSIYEVDGSYRLGPSPRSLDQYTVRIRNGNIEVKLNSVTLGKENEVYSDDEAG